MELVNITYAGEGVQPVDLDQQDRQLVVSNFINTQFGAANDYLELYIYDENGQLLDFDYDAFDYYPTLTANPQNNTYSSITLDPEKDLKNRGFNRGNLNIQYNFYSKLFNSAFGTFYWIKDISTSRTEIRLSSQVLSNDLIRSGFAQYQSLIAARNYYPVFYLNFGNNVVIAANNVALTEDDQGAYLVVKLYEPLPVEFDIKTQLWLVDKVAESVSFDITIQVEAEDVQQVNRLRGPNFNVKVNDRNGQTTPYYNYDNLLTSPVTSSFQKLLSYYQDRSIAINVDYSDFKNFIHFSSAVERVNNFVYKLQLIENYNAEQYSQSLISGGSGSSIIVSSSINSAQQAINNIIEKFDTYEYFLYFNSSSFAWPKRTNTQPYQLYSVTSSQAVNFLGGINIAPSPGTQSLLWSASYYDATNKDLLHNSVPQYLLDDPNNQPYITFLDMIGQHFDNIWVYYKDLSNRFNATNNPDTGISLDVVGDALRGFGVQLYTNSNVSDNLYYTLFGINPDGSLLPPTGSELITNYVTSSLTTLSAKDIQQELYKRLYHNLPYLLKSKGTERGIKALVSTFGIPDNILTVREFGGTATDSVNGVFDLDSSTYKVAIVTGSGGNVTGSLTLSSSLLHPEISLQYYQNVNRINTTNVEVGFSPADTINKNINTNLGYFDIDQLIGNPSLQYESSYTPLVSASNAYFSTYTQPNSIWEYIRLIKFYNNSLFKMIKDYVPARSNLSTGIIVKSHMLERNKYERHEPNVTFNDYSQSIDTAFISGSDGGALPIESTNYTGSIMTSLGPIEVLYSDDFPRYTGEFSGSNILVTDGQELSQYEISQLPSSSLYVTYSLGALYQNVTQSVRSEILFDVDYNGNQLTPVNYGIVTQSINGAQINNFATYTNPNSPYAYVQDYNYFLQRSIIPRYSGSRVESATYNTYTSGDRSYGKTAAIDKIKYQYAYLVDIYSSSLFMPNRSNAQIKYIIDNNENVLDLTKANKNIFSVQNIYKSGESVNISLFDYDESNPYVQQLANNPTLQIFEGGFRYLPILHNIGGNAVTQSYALTQPTTITFPVGGSPANLDPSFFTVSESFQVTSEEDPNRAGRFIITYYWYITPQTSSLATQTPTSNVQLGIRVNTVSYTADGDTEVIPVNATYDVTIPSGTNKGNTVLVRSVQRVNEFVTNYDIDWEIVSVSGGGTSTSGSFSTIFTTQVSSSVPCIFYNTASQQLVFNSTISEFSDSLGITFNSTSDPAWAGSTLEPVILPFTLERGDKISVFDSASRLGWDERFEYTVNNVQKIGTGTGSRILVDTVPIINTANLLSGSVDSVTGANFRLCRYIVWKHVPDETNVMLRYSPKDNTIIENGILFPEFIDPIVRDNAGNVIKSLKQQNLIQ